MIELRITTYQAVQLDSLLDTLSIMASPDLPDEAREGLARGFSNSPELNFVAQTLKAELDNLMQAQQVTAKKSDHNH